MESHVFSYADPSMPPVKRGLIRLVEAATGQRRLKRLYLDSQRRKTADESFWASAVRGLALDVRFDPAALAAIPKTGPLVIVANHPYGVLDGLVIAWLVEKARPDFRVLTNAVLLRAPEVGRHLLPVDFSGTEAALRTNLASRAAARRHLDEGGCVVVFPAGGISTAPDRLGRRQAVDGPWQPFTAQLIQRTRANVVPICFEGQNSRLFQIASHVSQTLRLSLIFREVKSRIGTELGVAVGDVIPFADLAGLGDRQALIDALRARTDALSARFPSRHDPHRLLARLNALKGRTKRLRGALRAAGDRAPGRQPRPR